ncbi:MAG TPA: hypothetical protein VF941_19070, partial [Clostridia bacterium]
TIQLLLYLFINNVYLAGRMDIIGNMRFIPVSSSSGDIENINVRIPENSEGIAVSYDLKYVSYKSEDGLVILDSKSGKPVKTLDARFGEKDKEPGSASPRARLDFCRWFPDKNIILYALSAPDDADAKIQIQTYDAESDDLHVGATIKSVSDGSKVQEAVFSTLNMLTYLKVKTDKTRSSVYRINLMDEISSPFSLASDTTIKNGYYSENIVCQNSKGQVYLRKTSGQEKRFNIRGKACLIDITGDSSKGKDIVYIGELDNSGKVTSIYYGLMDEDVSKWTKIVLKNPCLPDNLIVRDSQVYSFSDDEGSLINLNTSKSVRYKGKFIDFKGGKTVSLKDNTVISN